MKPIPFLAALALAVPAQSAEPAPAKADEKPLPGHSMNGDAFNEGPRQAAVLMEGTGKVHLAVTTKVELAQKFFDQGLGQIHGFWYFEAERSFRQAAALDADCAMAYWGMAMANINNPKRAADFITEAVKRKDKAGRQEQLYIGAWGDYYAETKKDERVRRKALVKALEDLIFEFPDDIEAKALLVFQLWDNKSHDVPLTSRLAADALLQQVLAKDAMHPGAHHYAIHLWNGEDGDKRALRSAAVGGQSAPGIAHLWHMPGHTFSNLKRYADAAWQQEASARVDHAYTIASRVMPDQIHNFAHNNSWLIQDLQYTGRVHDGVDLAKNMMELPRPGPSSQQSYKLGRERLFETLRQFEMWDDLTGIEATMYADACEDPTDDANRVRALGVAWFSKGDAARGQQHLESLKSVLAKTREERIKAADEAEAKAKKEKKSEDEIVKAMGAAMRKFASRITTIESGIAELRLTRALAAGDLDAARAQLALATDLTALRQAQIQLALADNAKAESLARDALKGDDAKVLPLAVLAETLWKVGKKDEALDTFKKLRALSAQLDLDVPAFARLAPLAQELKLSTDWRAEKVIAPDVGERPDLAKLGPFRWHPTAAPAWSLPDQKGVPVSLADFAGKPVLSVFYLGNGCAGCMEQLNIFAPKVKAYADAGVQVVAVSTDSADGLEKTFAKAKEGQSFGFPIVSDSGLGTFKAYRAFDDFENIPLHGIFLVDGAGLVRWQNIGYQPFRDADWLLGECKRLLADRGKTLVSGNTRGGGAAIPPQ